MPERNEIWRKDTPKLPDGWRYRIEIRPCHTDQYSTPTVTDMPPNSIKEFEWTYELDDEIPVGIYSGSAKMTFSAQHLGSTTLWDYLTGIGQQVVYGLVGRCVIIVSSDLGTTAAEEDDSAVNYDAFQPRFIGIQTGYLPEEQKGNVRKGPGELTIEFVAAYKAILEAIPMASVGGWIRNHISALGGNLTPEYTSYIRGHLWDFQALRDGDTSRLYAVVNRMEDFSQEAVLVTWGDIFDAISDLASTAYEEVMRESGFTIEFDANHVTRKTPFAFIKFREGYDSTAGTWGDDIHEEDLWTVPFIRETTVSELPQDQVYLGGLLVDGNGWARDDKTVWDWLQDITRFGICRVGPTHSADGDYTMYAVMSWDESATQTTPVVYPTRITGDYTIRQAAGFIGSASATVPFAAGEDLSSYTAKRGSLSDNLPSVDLRGQIGTHPSGYSARAFPVSAIESDNFPTLDDMATFSTANQNIMYRPGFHYPVFYYRMRNAANGGPAYVQDDNEFVRVFHGVSHSAGYTGNYSLPNQEIPLPDSDVWSEWWSLWFLATAALQNLSFQSCVAHFYAKCFSNIDQTVLECTVERPNNFGGTEPWAQCSMAIDDVEPGTRTHLQNTSVILSVTESPMKSTTDLKLFIKPWSQ